MENVFSFQLLALHGPKLRMWAYYVIIGMTISKEPIMQVFIITTHILLVIIKQKNYLEI